MVLPQIDLGDNGDMNEDFKEKSDAIRDSLTFDFPILFKSNQLTADETKILQKSQQAKHLQIPIKDGLNSVRRKDGNHPRVTLSWENVNVFKKNEFKFKNIFNLKRKTKDSSYLLHKDSHKNQMINGAVKTISFTRNAGENQSLESLSSNSSTTSSSSSSSSNDSKYFETNQILFNGKYIFSIPRKILNFLGR